MRTGPQTGLLRSAGRLIVLIVGIYILLVGLVKLEDLGAFRDTVRSHAILEDRLVLVASYVVPVVELITGIMVICLTAWDSRFAAAAPALLAALFGAFSLYAFLVYNDPPSTPVSCGCGLQTALVENWGVILLRNSVATLFFNILGAAWLVFDSRFCIADRAA